MLTPLSCLGRAAHPGNSKEEMTALGCTSQDGGPGISHNGEDNKERISGEEVEKNDQDCAVTEAAGWLARACWAEQEGKEAKRTAVDAGLPPGSWRKHMRPSS